MVKLSTHKSSKVISKAVIFFFDLLFDPSLALENTNLCGRRSLASKGSFDSNAPFFPWPDLQDELSDREELQELDRLSRLLNELELLERCAERERRRLLRFSLRVAGSGLGSTKTLRLWPEFTVTFRLQLCSLTSARSG